jgi:hypothetical protein
MEKQEVLENDANVLAIYQHARDVQAVARRIPRTRNVRVIRRAISEIRSLCDAVEARLPIVEEE